MVQISTCSITILWIVVRIAFNNWTQILVYALMLPLRGRFLPPLFFILVCRISHLEKEISNIAFFQIEKTGKFVHPVHSLIVSLVSYIEKEEKTQSCQTSINHIKKIWRDITRIIYWLTSSFSLTCYSTAIFVACLRGFQSFTEGKKDRKTKTNDNGSPCQWSTPIEIGRSINKLGFVHGMTVSYHTVH